MLVVEAAISDGLMTWLRTPLAAHHHRTDGQPGTVANVMHTPELATRLLGDIQASACMAGLWLPLVACR